jgi:hypothetical protein
MAERFKAAVLKTADSNGSGSSNLSPSARKKRVCCFLEKHRQTENLEPKTGTVLVRRDDREAEGARLLSECGEKSPPRVRIPLSPPYLLAAEATRPGKAPSLQVLLPPQTFPAEAPLALQISE